MACAVRLELSDGICHCDVRRYLDLEVDMVLIGIHRFDLERWILFTGLVEAFLEFWQNIALEYFPSAPRSPDYVELVLVG